MNSFLKVGKVIITDTVDSGTGEVLGSTRVEETFLAGNRDDFFLCYGALLHLIIDMTIAEVKTYMWLLSQYSDGTKFDISKKLRVEIGNKTGLNERSIYNIIPDLEKKKLIVRMVDTGLYVINPRYAFKGSSSTRAKNLKYILENHCPLC